MKKAKKEREKKMLLSEAGVPARTVNALRKKKILTVDDLLRKTPRAYKDYRKVKPIYACQPDTFNAVAGTLTMVDARQSTKRYLMIRMLSDDGVSVSILIFSRLFLYRKFYNMVNTHVVITGKVTSDAVYGYHMNEPDNIVPYDEFQPGIVPVYSKVKGISETGYRDLIERFLPKVHEPFEWELMNRHPITDYKTALTMLHAPNSPEEIQTGQERLNVNDLLYFDIGLTVGNDAPTDSKIRFPSDTLYRKYIDSLPFELTGDQSRALETIKQTCNSGKRLNTLLYGDVGAGKTAVAFGFMMLAVSNGYQAVLMAPRGVLAEQHYRSFLKMTGLPEETVVHLRSGMKAGERREALKAIAEGRTKVIIGTHSCVSEAVKYKALGAVVVDEEHLFGVNQKQEILKKAEEGVHMLSMSATPIPRTLATAVYGKTRYIERLMARPAGRLPIKTAIISDRRQAYPFLHQQIKAGRQCYIVCPAVEDSEDQNLVSIETIEKEYGSWFGQCGITYACVSGKTAKADQEKIMQDFSAGKTNVLISTTVVEVGVDVPNSTVIVIEQAEQFGLASLHQLRGRVGRGKYQSYCILRSDELDNARLKTIQSTTDGMKIAEADLKQRGSGDLFGTSQSGDNRFIDLMLSHPQLFNQIEPLAEWCVQNHFGEGLKNLYEESEEES